LDDQSVLDRVGQIVALDQNQRVREDAHAGSIVE
jgi:hypothetical protein